MRIVAVNGSPRKGWNTEKMLQRALDGAKSVGAEVEMLQLYAQPFKGCISCFACKRNGNSTGGMCAFKDALTPVLESVRAADAFIIGSPVYFGAPTGMVRSFLERLMFPVDTYLVDGEGNRVKVLHDTTPTAIIYTMNCPDWLMAQVDYPKLLGSSAEEMSRLFGYCETLYACDTYQFSDYDRYDCNMFSKEDKARQRDTRFPIDLQNAFDLGRRLAVMAGEAST